MLYTEADLEAAMDKIETINFHEEKEVSEGLCDYVICKQGWKKPNPPGFLGGF